MGGACFAEKDAGEGVHAGVDEEEGGVIFGDDGYTGGVVMFFLLEEGDELIANGCCIHGCLG